MHAISSSRNVDIDEINNQVVALLEKATKNIYSGIDSFDNCDNGDVDVELSPEYLNTLNLPNFPPYKLRLRQNAIIMLIRNSSI